MNAREFYQIISGFSVMATKIMKNGIDMGEYNEKLAKCTTEEQRNNLKDSLEDSKKKTVALGESVAKLIDFVNQKKESKEPFLREDHDKLIEYVSELNASWGNVKDMNHAKGFEDQIAKIERELMIIDPVKNQSLTEAINSANTNTNELEKAVNNSNSGSKSIEADESLDTSKASDKPKHRTRNSKNSSGGAKKPAQLSTDMIEKSLSALRELDEKLNLDKSVNAEVAGGLRAIKEALADSIDKLEINGSALPKQQPKEELSAKDIAEIKDERERKLRECHESFFILMATASKYKDKSVNAMADSLLGMNLGVVDKLLDTINKLDEAARVAYLQQKEEELDEIHHEVVREQFQYDSIVEAIAEKMFMDLDGFDRRDIMDKIMEGPFLRQMLDQDGAYDSYYKMCVNNPSELYEAYKEKMLKANSEELEDEIHEMLYEKSNDAKHEADKKEATKQKLCKESSKFTELQDNQAKKIKIATDRLINESKNGQIDSSSLALLFAERIVQGHMNDLGEKKMNRGLINKAKDYVNNTDYEKEMEVISQEEAFKEVFSSIKNGDELDENKLNSLYDRFLINKQMKLEAEEKAQQNKDVNKKENAITADELKVEEIKALEQKLAQRYDY